MAERVVVHVGPPKSGTTYLQTMVWTHRETLRRHGVLVPGRTPFDHNLLATATRDDAPGPRARTRARRLAEVIADWPGTVVVSCEWFADHDGEAPVRFGRLVAGAPTTVVVTARDLEAVAPAAWQERLKLGFATPLDAFVDGLAEPGGRWSWTTLDPAVVARRWSADAIVTVPAERAAPGVLWDRFAAAAGIADVRLEPDVTVANESLAVGPARLLEVVGPRLREAIDADSSPWPEQYRWLRRFVGHDLLVPRRGERIALAPAQSSAVRARSRSTRDALAAEGYAVFGDLADLTPEHPRPGVHPASVSDAELVELAGDLIADLLRALRAEAARTEAATRE